MKGYLVSILKQFAGRSTFKKIPFVFYLSTLPKILTLPPRSLFHDRSLDQVRPGIRDSLVGRVFLTLSGYYTKQLTYRRGARNLFDAIQEKAQETKFYRVMGLDQDFPGTQAVLSLHMWLLIRRLDQETEGKKVSQIVYDEFLEDVEIRLNKEGVKVRFNSLLVDLEKRFYGACIAYDKALGSNPEEPFTEALVRNVYQRVADKSAAAEVLAKYLQREIECLKLTETENIIQGKIKFTTLE